MSISIITIPDAGRMISNSQDRDNSKSSSADLFAKIVFDKQSITSSNVTGFLDSAVIHGLKMNIWRHETGDVSNTAVNSSAFLGMDEIEFTLPCSDIDITAVQSIANGQTVDVTFTKTGNINSHSVKIESFVFTNAQIVSTFFLIQTAVTPSVSIRFKAKNIQITRYDYDEQSGKAKGQKVYFIDFVSNTSK